MGMGFRRGGIGGKISRTKGSVQHVEQKQIEYHNTSIADLLPKEERERIDEIEDEIFKTENFRRVHINELNFRKGYFFYKTMYYACPQSKAADLRFCSSLMGREFEILISRDEEHFSFSNHKDLEDILNELSMMPDAYEYKTVKLSELTYSSGIIYYGKFKCRDRHFGHLNLHNFPELKGRRISILTRTDDETFLIDSRFDIACLIEAMEKEKIDKEKAQRRFENDAFHEVNKGISTIDNYNKSHTHVTPTMVKHVEPENPTQIAKQEKLTEVAVPWTAVKFRDGRMQIYLPSYIDDEDFIPTTVQDSRIKFKMNYIDKEILEKLTHILVECKDKHIVRILNMRELFANITHLSKLHIHTQQNSTGEAKSMTIEEVLDKIREKKTTYLKFLTEKHIGSQNAFSCKEIRLNSSDYPVEESAYIFILDMNDEKSRIVFENCLPARASIVFEVQTDQLYKAVTLISKFFASDTIKNKRQLLLHHTQDFTASGIISYCHIFHNDFEKWKQKLLSI